MLQAFILPELYSILKFPTSNYFSYFSNMFFSVAGMNIIDVIEQAMEVQFDKRNKLNKKINLRI